MANKKQFKAQNFIDAIPGTGGIITAIARKVGCDWRTAKDYITNYPTIKQAYQNEKETVTDMVETSLITQAKNGEGWAVKYYLSTQAKERGYVERQQVENIGEPQKVVNYTADEWKAEQKRRRQEAAEIKDKFSDVSD